MNKHIVNISSLRVNVLFLGALCPSKSGLMNKHIVNTYREYTTIFGALHPSMSGLLHKHIAKQTQLSVSRRCTKTSWPRSGVGYSILHCSGFCILQSFFSSSFRFCQPWLQAGGEDWRGRGLRTSGPTSLFCGCFTGQECCVNAHAARLYR